MEMQELKQIMQRNGIVGAGGAGFPSYAKLDERIGTVVLNCAECEPLLRVHRQLLAAHAGEILRALDETALAVGAGEAVIAVKEAYTGTVEAVEQALSEGRHSVPMRIGLLPEIYPAGDEVVTIYEVTGKTVLPGKLPLDVGVAVFNVETMYNTYRALFENQPVTHKYLTVAGQVAEPRTLCAPVGMKLKEVVALAGGATAKKPRYIHGGPMTGPLSSGEDVITKTSNAVLVLDESHPVIQKKLGRNSVNMKRAMACCCQCRMCTDLCPRNLLGHPIEPHAFMRAATTGVTVDLKPFLDTFFCSQCGLCEMFSCNQGLSPRKLIGEYKDGLRKNGVTPPKDAQLLPVNPFREERRVPMDRLIARLSLKAFDREAPLYEEAARADVVRINLNQHIGAPAVPAVRQGDRVEKGCPVAEAPEGKLSVFYHAPVDGIILEAEGNYVMIKAAGAASGKDAQHE